MTTATKPQVTAAKRTPSIDRMDADQLRGKVMDLAGKCDANVTRIAELEAALRSARSVIAPLADDERADDREGIASNAIDRIDAALAKVAP